MEKPQPLKPKAPLAPLAPLQPMMPTQPLTPAGGSFGTPPVSTFDSVMDSYEKAKPVEVQTNEPAVANDIFDPFFNKEVRSKYTDSIAPAIPAMAELVKRQFTSYSDEGVFGGLMTNLELIGESLDKVTGLPMRAVVNKFQTGEPIGATIKEGFTTNNSVTGRDIRQQAGVDFGNDIGNWLGDIATEIVLDPTVWIGIGAATKLGKSNKALQGINAALETGQRVAGRTLMNITPMGLAKQGFNASADMLNLNTLLKATPAKPITLADDIKAAKVTPEVNVTQVSGEIPIEQVADTTDKVQKIISKHPVKGELVEMDDLAKQQSALDELFISSTNRAVDEVFGKTVYRNYDAKEFYDLVNAKLINKDTTDLDLIDEVVKKFETYRTSEQANELPLLKQYAEKIQTQLEHSCQQLQDYDVVRKLIEEEGEYDLLFTTEFFIEKLKERGLGGRWDEDMIYTWQKSVEPALKEMKRNPHLLEQHPELKEIRDFFLWIENPKKAPIDEKAIGQAIDRASNLLDRKQLNPMNTEGFDFIFERAHSGTVPVTEAERIKAGLTQPEYRGYELMQVTNKVDRELDMKLAKHDSPALQSSLQSEINKQIKDFQQMDRSRLSRYSDDSMFFSKIEEELEDFSKYLETPRRAVELVNFYDEFGIWKQSLLDYLDDNIQMAELDQAYKAHRDSLTTTLARLRSELLTTATKERQRLSTNIEGAGRQNMKAMSDTDRIALQIQITKRELENLDKTYGRGIEEILAFTDEFESKFQTLYSEAKAELMKYQDSHAHLQLNKQRTQNELVHNIRASDALNKLFSSYEDKESAFSWVMKELAPDIDSVKALNKTVESIQSFERFTKQFEEVMLKAGHDYDFDNRSLDALYGYLEQMKTRPKQNRKLLRDIQHQEELLAGYYERANRKGSKHLLEVNIPQEEEVLRRMKADLKHVEKPVDLPDILSEYSELIKQYVDDMAAKGLDIARVPDGDFSSQLKHVSDDLKNQFPMMEAVIDSRTPNWSIEGLLAGDGTLDEAMLKELQDAFDMKKADDIRKFKATQQEITRTLDEAKGATREILRVYKDENRRLSNMFVSNEDAWEFAKGFQKGYKDIAEYLQAENPRIMIKNGAGLSRQVQMKTWAKSVFPDQPTKREEVVNRMMSHIKEAGADEGTAIDMFLNPKENHRLDVKFGESGKEIEKKLYEELFPGLKYEGDEFDLKMKNAIRRTELIKRPEVMVDLVADRLTPKLAKENLIPDNFADNVREVYNTFRNREYTEALDYLVAQATKDAWDFLRTNKKQTSKLYQELMSNNTPLSRDAILKGMVDNPMLQIAQHPKLNTWESASQIFKANPELRAVAVVESPKMPDGYTVKSFKLNNKLEYDQAIRLNAMVLDYESSEHLRSLFKNNPFRDKPLLQFWQKWFVQTYKVQALINVGFHVSNIFDLMLKNVSQGSIVQAPSNMFNILKGQLDYLNYTHRLKYKDLSRMTAAERDLYQEVASFRRTLASGSELTNEAIREGRSTIEKARQWALYDNPISKGNQYIGNTLEEGGRLALFRQMKAQGKGTSRALQTILDTHFDYSNKSEAMQWAELIFPFTTFAVRNFLYWASQMGENPKLVEYLYKGLQYNYAEHGYDTNEGISNEYIKSSMGKGNLIMEDKIIKNGNSMLEAMNFMGDPVQTMSNRIHPIIKASIQEWAGDVADWDNLRENNPMIPAFLGEPADWSRAVPFNGQHNTIQKVLGTNEKPNDLGLWNTVATPFYDPRLRNYDSYDYKGQYPDYPDYPKGQKYYPRYHKSRSYSTFRRTRSYNFYKSLYTATGKSRLAMRLTPTNYQNLEGRIANDRYRMKY